VRTIAHVASVADNPHVVEEHRSELMDDPPARIPSKAVVPPVAAALGVSRTEAVAARIREETRQLFGDAERAWTWMRWQAPARCVNCLRLARVCLTSEPSGARA
jgi:hypothetical protein